MKAMQYAEGGEKRLSQAQRKLVSKVLKEDIGKNVKEVEYDLAIAMCYMLHKTFGFGQARLKKAVQEFEPVLTSMLQRYDMQANETTWLCEKKLKDAGYDLDYIFGKGMIQIDYEITDSGKAERTDHIGV